MMQILEVYDVGICKAFAGKAGPPRRLNQPAARRSKGFRVEGFGFISYEILGLDLRLFRA